MDRKELHRLPRRREILPLTAFQCNDSNAHSHANYPCSTLSLPWLALLLQAWILLPHVQPKQRRIGCAGKERVDRDDVQAEAQWVHMLHNVRDLR